MVHRHHRVAVFQHGAHLGDERQRVGLHTRHHCRVQIPEHRRGVQHGERDPQERCALLSHDPQRVAHIQNGPGTGAPGHRPHDQGDGLVFFTAGFKPQCPGRLTQLGHRRIEAHGIERCTDGIVNLLDLVERHHTTHRPVLAGSEPHVPGGAVGVGPPRAEVLHGCATTAHRQGAAMLVELHTHRGHAAVGGPQGLGDAPAELVVVGRQVQLDELPCLGKWPVVPGDGQTVGDGPPQKRRVAPPEPPTPMNRNFLMIYSISSGDLTYALCVIEPTVELLPRGLVAPGGGSSPRGQIRRRRCRRRTGAERCCGANRVGHSQRVGVGHGQSPVPGDHVTQAFAE